MRGDIYIFGDRRVRRNVPALSEIFGRRSGEKAVEVDGRVRLGISFDRVTVGSDLDREHALDG